MVCWVDDVLLEKKNDFFENLIWYLRFVSTDNGSSETKIDSFVGSEDSVKS